MGHVAHCVGLLGATRPTMHARLQFDLQLPARDMTYSVMHYNQGRLALGAFISTLIIVKSAINVL